VIHEKGNGVKGKLKDATEYRSVDGATGETTRHLQREFCFNQQLTSLQARINRLKTDNDEYLYCCAEILFAVYFVVFTNLWKDLQYVLQTSFGTKHKNY